MVVRAQLPRSRKVLNPLNRGRPPCSLGRQVRDQGGEQTRAVNAMAVVGPETMAGSMRNFFQQRRKRRQPPATTTPRWRLPSARPSGSHLRAHAHVQARAHAACASGGPPCAGLTALANTAGNIAKRPGTGVIAHHRVAAGAPVP